ncbi:MAG: hypothetical protein J7K47_04020 [Thermoplasmata archaeon]|nr:hypothetical protein [Thermoplasmata archaeon]
MEFRSIQDLKEYIKELEKHRHHPQDYIFGIELEGALIDREGKPLDAGKLIPRLNQMHQDFEFDKEAGKCQIEIRSFPREYSCYALREMEEYLHDAIHDIVELAERIHKTEAIFLLLGSNPHPSVLADEWISDTQRAKKMAEWRSNFPSIKIGNRSIEARHIAIAIQSIHVHIQGKSPQDVVEKYNRLLYMVPEQIAISANSPIIGGELLDYREARLLLYELADGGNAGFPKLIKYPSSIIEYGEYVASFPSIMASSLTQMVKERHEDNRIRLEVPFRVENRVYPAQCTIKENMALIEYIVGRLKYAQRWSRQELPPIKEIEINRIEAIKEGLRGEFIWNGKKVSVSNYMMEGIEKAERGIKALDTNARYLNILRRRVKRKKSCADTIKRWYARKDDVEEKIAYIVNRVWQHTSRNQPII